ncbi:MAG: hypothetical protein EZS28_043697, partial [Streblomastix strix]
MHSPKESLGQDKATSKFHSIFELSKTSNQEVRIISTKIEQDQTMNSEYQRLECIYVPKLEHTGRDMLVKSKNRREQTNRSFDLDPINNSDNRCVLGQLGCNSQVTESGRRDLVPGGLVQEVETIQQQPTRDSGRSLRSNPFRAFLKEQAGNSIENRDRQQCYFLQSEQRGSCSISL